MNNTWTQWLIALVFLGFTGYSAYKSVRVFLTFKEKLAEFKEVHKDAQKYNDGNIWVAVLSIVGLLCIFVMIFVEVVPGTNLDQVFYYRLAYGCFAIIFLGMALETYVRRQAWFCQEGMFYVDTYYRFRMILSYEVQGSFVKNVAILMGNKDKIEVTRKLANEVQARAKVWKTNKKKGKHKRDKASA